MFVGFFETLAEALDAELTTGKQKVGEARSATAAYSSPSLHRRCRRRGGRCDWRSPIGNQPGKARARIEGLLAESSKRVMILMDDLDRLDKAEIQAILRP